MSVSPLQLSKTARKNEAGQIDASQLCKPPFSGKLVKHWWWQAPGKWLNTLTGKSQVTMWSVPISEWLYWKIPSLNIFVWPLSTLTFAVCTVLGSSGYTCCLSEPSHLQFTVQWTVLGSADYLYLAALNPHTCSVYIVQWTVLESTLNPHTCTVYSVWRKKCGARDISIPLMSDACQLPR